MSRLKMFEPPERPKSFFPSTRLNWWPGFNIVIASMGFVWLVWHVSANGFARSITLGNIIFFFLMVGVLFHWRPWRFLKASEEAGKVVWGIIIQFPFYAGIFGLFKYTELATTFTTAFVAIGSPRTLLVISYWYAGILNYLIPSGGSEWAVTAPYLIPAAKALAVPESRLVVAYAWGDMMTDMIQPFWAIAMLAIARLEFREIMGWLLLVFLVYFTITSIAFLIWPFF